MAGKRTVAQRYFEEFLTAPGNLEVADEIMTPDVQFLNPVAKTGIHGIAEYKAFAERWYVGFPDRVFTVDDEVDDGETVAVRFTITGTHNGEFMGIAPTGGHIEVNGMNLFKLKDGLIADVQAFFNPMELYGPLGLSSPPGGAPVSQSEAPAAPPNPTATDSGLGFEKFLEMEHVLGDRVIAAGYVIADRLKGVTSLDAIPPGVRAAMGIMVYLHEYFADQAHLVAEEMTIPLAVSRGMDPARAQWVLDHHEQARLYWKAIAVAWRRIVHGDAGDASYAIEDFWRCTEAFCKLFEYHAARENDVLFPEMGRYFTPADDALVMGIITHVGPPDMGPYVDLVAEMEKALGTTPPPPPPPPPAS